MRKGRKGRQKERRGRGRAKEMKMNTEEEEECMGAAEGEGEGEGEGGTRFFGCYLLTSLNPRYKGSTYIGFTVNPKRRIRQHNGEITSGASSTKKKRPWEMVLCIHGFPSHVSALQFEWAWQHPRDSLAVRETAASFKTLGGLPNKIKLALTMLTLPSWHSMDLSVSFFSTNYMKHAAGSPSLPPHMNLHFSSLDDLPCYSDPHRPYASNHDDGDDDIDDVHFTSFDKTPDFDFIQEHPSTDAHSDTQQYTPQHPSNDTLQYTPEYTCNQHAAGGTLDEDAPYMMSNSQPEEQLPSHQLPPNVCGSVVELLRPSLGDNVTPFPSYNFSNNVLPMLKKHVYLCTPSPPRNELNDDSRPSEEEPFRRAAPFVRDQPSTFDYVSVTNKDVGDEDLTCIFISETPEEKRRPVGKTRPNSHVDIVGPSSTKAIDPVEVIDLYTPSPDCRIAAVSKKRRISSDCSNFVDLTNSPLFLEL